MVADIVTGSPVVPEMLPVTLDITGGSVSGGCVVKVKYWPLLLFVAVLLAISVD